MRQTRQVKRTAESAAAEVTRVGFAPIVRVDAERREIELCATSETVDSYGTVFAYEASRDAFERWAGNVREMHERKAVGRRVAVRCDDAERRVYVRVRISRGAEDTWEKVRDGTLRGASIGASNVAWRTERRGGREVPVARRYDLVELSLVDLPSNPDAAGVTFVRDGVPVADVLDELDAEHAPAARPDGEDETPEQRITRDAMQAGQTALEANSLWTEQRADAPEADADGRTARTGTRAARLAALGAPDYVERAARLTPHPDDSGRDERLPREIPAAFWGMAGGQLARDTAAGVRQDEGSWSGDHERDRYTHAAHDHAHTGEPFSEGDLHRHTGWHLHLDGTSHTHEHRHDHAHEEHASQAHSQAGHSHPHIHAHDHGHAYRVHDGMMVDERLVLAGARWSEGYLGEHLFHAVGGVEGQRLPDDQARVALAAQRAVARHFRERREPGTARALGAFSDNPDGPPDTGVPARAEERPTSGQGQSSLPDGNQEAVFHTAARSILRGCGCPTCQAALAALDADDPAGGRNDGSGRAMGAVVTRALETHARRLDAAIQGVDVGVRRITDTLGEIERRVAAIEAQPMPGGPHLRTAEKTHALLPNGGQTGIGEQMRALEALAGRLADPQAQIAVATEMIRLQQEAAGLAPAMQVMPRAGSGAGAH
ncbi:MAG TPA: hypothetical protein VF818_11395 [Ktedonobacterales bacterium]